MKNILDLYEGVRNRYERIALAKRERENINVYLDNDDYIDNQIKKLEKQIILLKEAKSINEHMRTRGWEFFDISDDVIFDEDYIPFVGTRKELFERIPNPSCYSEE